MAVERDTSPEPKRAPQAPRVFPISATAEERRRRQEIWDELLELRKEIGPIKGITTAELLDRENDQPK